MKFTEKTPSFNGAVNQLKFSMDTELGWLDSDALVFYGVWGPGRTEDALFDQMRGHGRFCSAASDRASVCRKSQALSNFGERPHLRKTKTIGLSAAFSSRAEDVSLRVDTRNPVRVLSVLKRLQAVKTTCGQTTFLRWAWVFLVLYKLKKVEMEEMSDTCSDWSSWRRVRGHSWRLSACGSVTAAPLTTYGLDRNYFCTNCCSLEGIAVCGWWRVQLARLRRRAEL